MILDWLSEEGAPAIVRLYAFDRCAVGRLHEALVALHEETLDRLELHEQPWIDARDCALTLTHGRWYEEGVRALSDGAFLWRLTPLWWGQASALCEPFLADATGGFQWLDAHDVPLLLSDTPDGAW